MDRMDVGGDAFDRDKLLLFNVPMDPYDPMDFMELPVELTFRRKSGVGSRGGTTPWV